MARIRTIKPEFFTSADIASLTPLARLFYVSMWCEADRAGRIAWNPKTFKLRYFPADSCDISSMADECIEAGLIVLYEVDGKQYAEIPTFGQHQVINNRESDSNLPENPRVKDASPRVTGEGRKEGRERKGKEYKPPLTPPAGGGSDSGKEKTQAIAFKTFIENCKEKNEQPISDYRPVFDYAESIGLPEEFLVLCWNEFYRKHMPGGTDATRRQRDWRLKFRKCVEGNWFKLWWDGPQGIELTTAGRTAMKVAA